MKGQEKMPWSPRVRLLAPPAREPPPHQQHISVAVSVGVHVTVAGGLRGKHVGVANMGNMVMCECGKHGGMANVWVWLARGRVECGHGEHRAW